MHWNYRVMREVHKTGEDQEILFAIHEVYYEKDEIKGWSAEPMYPTWDMDDIEAGMDAKILLEKYAKAFEHPILDYETGEEIKRLYPQDEK